MDNSHFGIFSEKEEQGYLRIRKMRDAFLNPVVKFLSKVKVTPDQLTILSFLFIFPCVFFLNSQPLLSLLFLIFHLVTDAVDGALARHTKSFSLRGAFMDHACDYAFFFIFILALIYYHLVNGFWGAFFLVNYILMLGVLIALNYLKISSFFVYKSRNTFYVLFLILALSSFNLLDPFVVFFTVYMLLSNAFLFNKLRCSL